MVPTTHTLSFLPWVSALCASVEQHAAKALPPSASSNYPSVAFCASPSEHHCVVLLFVLLHRESRFMGARMKIRIWLKSEVTISERNLRVIIDLSFMKNNTRCFIEILCFKMVILY